MNKNICRGCEFCFPGKETDFVCAGENYGEDISQSLDVEKNCYSEGLEDFIERSEDEDIVFEDNVKLSELKIDGRSRISLIDKENKIINIKASKAKKILGDVLVEKVSFETDYYVNGVFSGEMFKGSMVLNIK